MYPSHSYVFDNNLFSSKASGNLAAAAEIATITSKSEGAAFDAFPSETADAAAAVKAPTTAEASSKQVSSQWFHHTSRFTHHATLTGSGRGRRGDG